MATLYVTEQGVQVHKQGERLLIKRGSETLEDIPLIKVDRVVVMGRGVNLTTPALYALTRLNIDVLYLNSRGRYSFRTVGREHKHSRLRQAQAIATADPVRAMRIAQAIVDGKINNQRVLVRRHLEGSGSAQGALRLMDSMRQGITGARDLDELRGREGMAAKAYFGLLRELLRPPTDGHTWGFETRAYYPPPDPVNALLSFGYTLLLNDLVAACQKAGLDPDLGFFHAIDYNRPSMALDLEEEFRPVIVDSIVLAAVNRPVFGLKDFEVGIHKDSEESPTPSEDGRGKVRPIYLKEEARKRFISLYEARINETILYPSSGEATTYRRIFELQAYRMAKTILGETEGYVPFTIR